MQAFPTARFPWATLFVNICGCLLVGIVAALLERVSTYNTELRLLIITGFLGGFTTFSAFGLETFALLREELFMQALLNIAYSIMLGLIAVYLGFRVGSAVS